MNLIYCFSLYCEGHIQTKSQVFVTIRDSEQVARDKAEEYNLACFPVEQGWYNHQMTMIVIPKEKILALAKEYNETCS